MKFSFHFYKKSPFAENGPGDDDDDEPKDMVRKQMSSDNIYLSFASIYYTAQKHFS